MAYVRKLIAKEENLIGIARVHWIYIVKGLVWFLGFSAAGWALNWLVLRGLFVIASSLGGNFVPLTLLSLNNGVMYVMMATGFMMFFFMVMKVLFTEVALTSRRVIHKWGLMFVKVQQIDLEEIRGENIDLGTLGRVLGYGYLMLDCRFIGDVRLPAIENPEGFNRALHLARSKSQDSLSVVVGKGNPAPLNVQAAQPEHAAQAPAQMQQPEIQPSQPNTPEITPPQQEPGPEINPPRTPTELPVPPTQPPPQPAPQEPPPVQPPAQPPQQPVPAPPPSEPPLQPPGTTQAAETPVAPSQPIDPKIIAEVVQQLAPQMAQQVAKELVEQGVIEAPVNDDEEDLVRVFDQARLKDMPDDKGQRKSQYAVH